MGRWFEKVTFCRKIEFETIGPERQQQLEGLRPTLELFALQLSTIPYKYCCIFWTNIFQTNKSPFLKKENRANICIMQHFVGAECSQDAIKNIYGVEKEWEEIIRPTTISL